MEADFSTFQINLLVLADDNAFLEIDHAALAEAGNGLTGFGVEFDEAIADGDENDAVVALTVGPVRNAASGELARGHAGPAAFIHTVDPELFTGFRVEGNHGPARAGGGIKNAIHYDRCAFELVFEARSEIIGFEAPGDFEILKVCAVDLVEGRVLAASQIGRIHGPVALGCGRLPGIGAGLSLDAGREPDGSRNDGEGRRHNSRQTGCLVEHIRFLDSPEILFAYAATRTAREQRISRQGDINQL